MTAVTTAPATENYQRLRDTLRELFQLDQADLDFGIYRILNQRRKEVEAFLEEQLPLRVREALRANADAATDELRQQLEQAERQARELGIEPADSPKVQELRRAIGSGDRPEALENEVFSLLSTFFKRYYKQGDFISQRRYKKDTYAIPYEGEEVKLHWANHDQYYIKTGEHFKQYRFNLPGGKRVHFELREASTEQANNKAQAGKERRFKLAEEDFLTTAGDTLTLWFTYEPQDKKVKQDDLLREAFERVAPALPPAFQAELLRPLPTEKQKDRTVLHKHLKDYAARNTFDYFIHKDLGGFLGRELDFFIKNEVLLLDDVHLDDEREYARQRRMVRAVKAAAQPIIAFLAQLENFQKKLWLKKKFVVETNWCITLDRVPTDLYADIAANEAQRAAWVDLFAIQELPGYTAPLTVDFLTKNPYLVLDTRFFSEAPAGTLTLKQRLLNELSYLDKQCNGLLINSENFQALQLLQARYREQVKCVYIDPPYNTGEDGFAYKDDYRHSSWLSMMRDRLSLSKQTQLASGAIYTSINENELSHLIDLLNQTHGEGHYITTFSVKVRHENRILKGDKSIHEVMEYLLAYRVSEAHTPTKRIEDNTSLDEYIWEVTVSDDAPATMILGGRAVDVYAPGQYVLKKVEANHRALNRINIRGTLREGNSSGRFYVAHIEELASTHSGHLFRVPDIGHDGLGHRYFLLPDGSSRRRNGDYFQGVPINRAETKLVPYANLLDYEKQFNRCSDEGGVEFRNGKKPVEFIEHILLLAGVKHDKESATIDFFAGSGSAGHAVVELNREDDGQRKYILVEMGEYFDTVTKPRMQKVVYSRTWKEGKPVDREGISHCFKYLRLESYEDTLNNLQLKRSPEQTGTLGLDGAFAEDHLLHYLLDVEATGSLLGAQHFADPFNVTLRITRHNETKEERVDLVETFNYLLGLVVDTQEYLSGFVQVRGTLLTGEKVLVVWRNTQQKDNAALNEFFRRRDFRTRAKEFDLIYVNGDNNLQNERLDDEHWKVRLIEEEFLKRMFECRDV